MTPTPTAPTLRELHEALSAPFPLAQIVLKPGTQTRDHSRALALAFVDPRRYMERLDQVIGPERWSVSYQTTPTGVICRLTILGHVREDVGDFAPEGDPNRMTGAATQAFKRCCAAFGLGRYLYLLPQLWAYYDAARQCFADPAGVARQLYYLAGLPTEPASPTQGDEPHDPQRLAKARAVLGAGHEQALSSKTADATDAQLGLLARLIGEMQRGNDPEEAEAAAGAIDALGDTRAVAHLSTHTTREQLRALGLSKPAASALIQELKELREYAATAP